MELSNSCSMKIIEPVLMFAADRITHVASTQKDGIKRAETGSFFFFSLSLPGDRQAQEAKGQRHFRTC